LLYRENGEVRFENSAKVPRNRPDQKFSRPPFFGQPMVYDYPSARDIEGLSGALAHNCGVAHAALARSFDPQGTHWWQRVVNNLLLGNTKATCLSPQSNRDSELNQIKSLSEN
jgi:hypothetical protein